MCRKVANKLKQSEAGRQQWWERHSTLGLGGPGVSLETVEGASHRVSLLGKTRRVWGSHKAVLSFGFTPDGAGLLSSEHRKECPVHIQGQL